MEGRYYSIVGEPIHLKTTYPSACNTCLAGGAGGGGVPLVGGICQAWCSNSNSCGTGAAFKTSGFTDCRTYKEMIPGRLFRAEIKILSAPSHGVPEIPSLSSAITDTSTSQCLSTPSSLSFVKITSGRCDQVVGRERIANLQTCTTAATKLGLISTDSDGVVAPSAVQPDLGCYSDENGDFFFTEAETTMASCTVTKPCICANPGHDARGCDAGVASRVVGRSMLVLTDCVAHETRAGTHYQTQGEKKVPTSGAADKWVSPNLFFRGTIAPKICNLMCESLMDCDHTVVGEVPDWPEPSTATCTHDSHCQYAGCSAAAAFAARIGEVQSISTKANTKIEDGAFTVSSCGDTPESTTPLSWDASASNVKTALEALSCISETLVVSRTGPTAKGEYTWEVTFTSDGGDRPLLGVAANSVMQTASNNVVISETTKGAKSVKGSETWCDLDKNYKAAAIVLGYTQISWDNDSGVEGQPESSKLTWEKLTDYSRKKTAALFMGYTQISWDNDSGAEEQPRSSKLAWAKLDKTSHGFGSDPGHRFSGKCVYDVIDANTCGPLTANAAMTSAATHAPAHAGYMVPHTGNLKKVGDLLKYEKGSGTAITGLVDGNLYYVHSVSSDGGNSYFALSATESGANLFSGFGGGDAKGSAGNKFTPACGTSDCFPCANTNFGLTTGAVTANSVTIASGRIARKVGDSVKYEQHEGNAIAGLVDGSTYTVSSVPDGDFPFTFKLEETTDFVAGVSSPITIGGGSAGNKFTWSEVSILTTTLAMSDMVSYGVSSNWPHPGTKNGDFIKYERNGATAITGLVNGESYYVVELSEYGYGFKLSATKGGTAIAIGTSGSAGNRFSWPDVWTSRGKRRYMCPLRPMDPAGLAPTTCILQQKPHYPRTDTYNLVTSLVTNALTFAGAAHGRKTGDAVMYERNGASALIGGLADDTIYYVVALTPTNQYSVSATKGGTVLSITGGAAVAGSKFTFVPASNILQQRCQTDADCPHAASDNLWSPRTYRTTDVYAERANYPSAGTELPPGPQTSMNTYGQVGGSNDIAFQSSHGRKVGDAIKYTQATSAITGLEDGKTYYVHTLNGDKHFSLAAYVGGPELVISGDGSTIGNTFTWSSGATKQTPTCVLGRCYGMQFGSYSLDYITGSGNTKTEVTRTMRGLSNGKSWSLMPPLVSSPHNYEAANRLQPWSYNNNMFKQSLTVDFKQGEYKKLGASGYGISTTLVVSLEACMKKCASVAQCLTFQFDTLANADGTTTLQCHLSTAPLDNQFSDVAGGIKTQTDALMSRYSTVAGEDLTEPIDVNTNRAVAASDITWGQGTSANPVAGTGVALKFSSTTTEITSITVTNPGSGYVTGNTLTIAASALGTRTTAAVFTLSDGEIVLQCSTCKPILCARGTAASCTVKAGGSNGNCVSAAASAAACSAASIDISNTCEFVAACGGTDSKLYYKVDWSDVSDSNLESQSGMYPKASFNLCRAGTNDLVRCPSGFGAVGSGVVGNARRGSQCMAGATGAPGISVVPSTKYNPLDNIPDQGRTSTSSAAECQERCAATEGCAYWSRWNNGGCHLSSVAAVQVPGSSGENVVSGTRGGGLVGATDIFGSTISADSSTDANDGCDPQRGWLQSPAPGFCRGDSCCPDGSTCPSASVNKLGKCKYGKSVDCTEAFDLNASSAVGWPTSESANDGTEFSLKVELTGVDAQKDHVLVMKRGDTYKKTDLTEAGKTQGTAALNELVRGNTCGKLSNTQTAGSGILNEAPVGGVPDFAKMSCANSPTLHDYGATLPGVHAPAECMQFGTPVKGKWQADSSCCSVYTQAGCSDGYTYMKGATCGSGKHHTKCYAAVPNDHEQMSCAVDGGLLARG